MYFNIATLRTSEKHNIWKGKLLVTDGIANYIDHIRDSIPLFTI